MANGPGDYFSPQPNQRRRNQQGTGSIPDPLSPFKRGSGGGPGASDAPGLGRVAGGSPGPSDYSNINAGGGPPSAVRKHPPRADQPPRPSYPVNPANPGLSSYAAGPAPYGYSSPGPTPMPMGPMPTPEIMRLLDEKYEAKRNFMADNATKYAAGPLGSIREAPTIQDYVGSRMPLMPTSGQFPQEQPQPGSLWGDLFNTLRPQQLNDASVNDYAAGPNAFKHIQMQELLNQIMGGLPAPPSINNYAAGPNATMWQGFADQPRHFGQPSPQITNPTYNQQGYRRG